MMDFAAKKWYKEKLEEKNIANIKSSEREENWKIWGEANTKAWREKEKQKE